MRSVGLDLGARHIAWCQVINGMVTRRGSVHRLEELEPLLGTATPPARVAFEASREAWHVHDVMVGWGKEPVLLDTTRIRRIGVGQHGRKNDSIDAEAIATALDAGRVPVAHVLSPERRVLRAKLSVRSALVEMRARQVTLLRGLARATGVRISTSSTDTFLEKLQEAPIDESTRAQMAPLVATLTVAQKQLAEVDRQIAQVAKARGGGHRGCDLRIGHRRGKPVSQCPRRVGVLGFSTRREHDRRQAATRKYYQARQRARPRHARPIGLADFASERIRRSASPLGDGIGQDAGQKNRRRGPRAQALN